VVEIAVAIRPDGGAGGPDAPLQIVPLMEKDDGTVFAPEEFAVNPIPLTEPPGGICALYDALTTVTAWPLCVATPFHRFVICSLPPNVHRSVQPLIGLEPVLAMAIPVWNPPGQLFTML
jgi:hypothetical protein